MLFTLIGVVWGSRALMQGFYSLTVREPRCHERTYALSALTFNSKVQL